jgi:hypothetical protein
MQSLSSRPDMVRQAVWMVREAAWMVDLVVVEARGQDCRGTMRVSIVPSPAAALCCKKIASSFIVIGINSHYLQSLPDVVSPHGDSRENRGGFCVYNHVYDAFTLFRRLHRADMGLEMSANNFNCHMSVTIACSASSAHI